MADLDKFIRDQLSVWPLAAANFRSLKSMKVRHLEVGGLNADLQFNPCRISSTTARIDEQAIASRACFLCEANRPPEQFHVKFQGRKDRRYNIQVNPFPIFKGHLVIAREEHIPQAIWHHLPDMLDFAKLYRSYTVYYNGPRAGASAPDHLHFQAVPRRVLPLERYVDGFLYNPGKPLSSVKDATLYHVRAYTRGVWCLKAVTTKSLAKLFYQFLDCCPVPDKGLEPRFNLYAWFCEGTGEYRMMVVLRTELRSHHFYTDGPDHLTIGPGAAEMAGVFVAPCEEDFDKATPALLEEMLSEVSVSEEDERMINHRLTRTQPTVEVGIMSAQTIEFEIISDGAGRQCVSVRDGRLEYNGNLYDELYFDSVTPSTLFAEPSFILRGVTIGKEFHWQRSLDQRFAGSLKFIVEDGKVTAVNRIGLEDYLLSVISSEMNAAAPLELLKAHAVISRSWVLARMEARRNPATSPSVVPHTLYDVCADDHCQRYQGIDMAVGDNVRTAIDRTWGQVLRYNGELCDTRYSKCCGGRTEIFSTCWEDRDYPYLQSFEDPWCAEDSPEALASILNPYDLESRGYRDWEQRYTVAELSEIVASRTGKDLGEIESLEPLETGPSGRIKSLRINGSKGSLTVGKELAVRRALSPSHLKSSWFSTVREGDSFVLRGHGWGHGVGLCQVGAAIMASKGKDYREILQFYYRDARID